MITWGNLAGNALWILGCAIALATLSYASWQAAEHKQRLRDQLSKPGAQVSLDLAGILFCAGLAATSGAALNTVFWGTLGVLFAVHLLLILRQRRSSSPKQE